MHHFRKPTPSKPFTWWDDPMTQEERLDVRQAFETLEAKKKVGTGQEQSVTKNLSAVFDHLLEHKREYY